MGFNTVKTFKAWSFTRFSDYERCPAFAKYKHLDKLPSPKHPAADRGIRVAQQTEDWMNGDRRTMPKELKPLESEYRLIKRDPSTVAEASWGFTKDWEPCETTDWNRCWLRVKIDLCRQSKDGKLVKIDDNKTGKFSEYNVAQYMLQLDLYAAAGVTMIPTLEVVETRLLFSDLGIIHPKEGPAVYTAKQAMKSRKEWDKRVRPMLNDTRFAPRPSRACSWCPYSKSKGGPCKF
jgi:hypothetical protein